MNGTPRWLDRLEKNARWLSWISVPGIAILFVTLQALGFLMVSYDEAWIGRLALLPDRALAGEWYRLVTFLALPLSLSPLWVLVSLWFLYFLLSSIESVWGSFRTTLYVLVSIILTIAFSLAFGYVVTDVRHFEYTLTLAGAALFPELEMRLFFAIPVKMRWFAWLIIGLALLDFARGTWLDRAYLAAIYSNALLFFGPGLLASARQWLRRREFRRKLR